LFGKHADKLTEDTAVFFIADAIDGRQQRVELIFGEAHF